MSCWSDEKRGLLRCEPIDLTEELWAYEEPDGIQLWCGEGHVATLKRSTVLAYIKRLERIAVLSEDQ